jgi:hypothetical protein
MHIGILYLSSRSFSGIGLKNMPNEVGPILLCHTSPMISTQSPMITMSKDSNNIEKLHVLSNKENHPRDLDVNDDLVVDDINFSPPSNLGLPICIATNVDVTSNVAIVHVAMDVMQQLLPQQLCLMFLPSWNQLQWF